jgi:hypothetical protein
MRKGNKVLRQKKWKEVNKKDFFDKKNNKKEWTEDQHSNIWIASFHSLLSNASYLTILQSFKYLFTYSSHIKFGLLLPTISLPVYLITLLWTGASTSLHWICSNHLKWCCTSFSSTGATTNLSCMLSFWTRSLLMLPQIHHSMCISAALSYWICHLLVGQHSAPYNTGQITVL